MVFEIFSDVFYVIIITCAVEVRWVEFNWTHLDMCNQCHVQWHLGTASFSL